MKSHPLLALAALPLLVPVQAQAHHLDNLGTPYANRGQCEAAVADFSSDDWYSLLDRFPNYFTTVGDIASFLTRAFPCERQGDGKWYIQDHRLQVLQSEWFLRR